MAASRARRSPRHPGELRDLLPVLRRDDPEYHENGTNSLYYEQLVMAED